MKPLKVVLHAFGPYKDKVNVDFSRLNEKGLFAITGPTGAGKTTIFDGICFALFGEASGENRNDQTLLRSHFADDDLYTSVELTFELKGNHYNIFRQKGHQKKQNKGITGDKIEFYKIENEEKVPYCQEFNKTSIVNKKVEELLGINADQFKQIVLLPQGEFRKLLVSDTKEKEEILRKIFRTELFEKVTETLNLARKNIESKFTNLKQKIVIKLEVIEKLLSEKGIQIADDSQINLHIVNEILTEHIVSIMDDLKRLEENEKIQKSQLEVNQQKLFSAEAHNKNIERLHEVIELLTMLKGQEVEIEDKKVKIKLATNAEKVLPIKTELEKLKNSLQVTNDKLLFEIESLKETLIKIEKISAEVATLPEEQKKLGSLESQLSHLLVLKEDIDQFQNHKVAFQNKSKQILLFENEEKTLQEGLKKENEELNQLKQQLNDLEGVHDQWAKLSLLNKEISLKGGFAKRIFFAKKELEQKQNEYQIKNLDHVKLKNELDRIESEMHQQKAAFLAKDLKDQEHCPVCGSTHHPSLAKFNGTVNEEEAEKLKIHVNQFQTELATIQGEIKSKENSLKIDEQSFFEEHGQFDFTNEGLKALANEFNENESNLKNLTEKKATFEKINNVIKTKEQLIRDLTVKVTEKTEAMNKFTNELNELKIQIVQIESKLPESLRTLEKWQLEKNDIEKNIAILKAKISKIEEEYRILTEQKTVKETTRTHLEKEVLKLNEETRSTTILYHEKIAEYEFNGESEFISAIDYIRMIDQYRNDLSIFEENLQRLSTEKELLEKQVQSMEKIEVSELKMKVQEITQHLDAIVNEMIRIQELNKRLSQLKIDLQIYQEDFVKTEQKLAGLTDLYKVTKGDNDKMISFERYVLLDYFEQIIESANIRLDHLSNGQFQLQRKDAVEKGRKQSGLGLEVYDSYTGLARDVKTLSGGEQFNASLCLALGMADIIQAHKGGVSIDTLFIDEGFGSLDDELLSKAIDTLIQLQKSGRLIGVISHVQDVKDAMPAVIEVHKTNKGYSELSILIK
ncbi:AAA family ATPase [Gottfriedia sp. NPDC057948]|uniref:AAA family ATPase n=1 Tax=Gottfriedia sp. NPDC057948 TaxID=3346287 RepID=UPI0036DCF80A